MGLSLPTKKISDFTPRQFQLETIRMDYGANCPMACAHCGAHDPGLVGKEMKSIDPAILYQDLRLIRHYVSPWLTTDVNHDPLLSPVLKDTAMSICEATEGNSSLMVITHGGGRVTRLAELVRLGLVKALVITVDKMRHNGEISESANKNFYKRTIQALRLAMQYSVRVTLSFQGTNLAEVEEMERMVFEIFREVELTFEEFNKIHFDRRAGYVHVGKAAQLDGGSELSSDIIPDGNFLKCFEGLRTHKWRGMRDENGRILYQENKPGYTYDTTVNGEWGLLEF